MAVFLPEKSHGLKNLVGSWSHKESDMTEHASNTILTLPRLGKVTWTVLFYPSSACVCACMLSLSVVSDSLTPYGL